VLPGTRGAGLWLRRIVDGPGKAAARSGGVTETVPLLESQARAQLSGEGDAYRGAGAEEIAEGAGGHA
jgi:hypothetical protein